MSFTPTAAGQKLKDGALTKLLVYFVDGNSRTFYGRHESKNFIPEDPRALALLRQRRYIESVAKNVRVAIIYDNVNGTEIARYRNGSWV
jgi:hypothetical protein